MQATATKAKQSKPSLPKGFTLLAKPEPKKTRIRVTDKQQSLVVQLASLPNGITVENGRKVLLAASTSDAGKARLADPQKGRSWFSQYFVPSWITKYSGAGIAYKPGKDGKANAPDTRYLVFWKDNDATAAYREGCKADGPAGKLAKSARVRLA